MRYLQHIISNNINVTSPTEQLLEKNYYSILEKYDVSSESSKLVSELKNLFFPKKFLDTLNISENMTIANSTQEKKTNATETKAEVSPQNNLGIDSNMLNSLISNAGAKTSVQGEVQIENLIEKPVDLSSIQFLEMKDKVQTKKATIPVTNQNFLKNLRVKIENEYQPQELDAQEKMLDQQLIQGLSFKNSAEK